MFSVSEVLECCDRAVLNNELKADTERCWEAFWWVGLKIHAPVPFLSFCLFFPSLTLLGSGFGVFQDSLVYSVSGTF